MFKGIHPSFWIGLVIIYGLTAIFMLVEMGNPGFVYNTKIGDAPAIFYYLCFFMNLVVNIIIAWAWYYFPEQADKQRAAKSSGKGVTLNGS